MKNYREKEKRPVGAYREFFQRRGNDNAQSFKLSAGDAFSAFAI
jgi:hypothetical protein